jgi:hypothetical protein
MPKEKPDIELPLPASAGVRPVAGETHATAAQLAAALGLPDLDDAFLRNHAKDGIPKPVKSKYPINDTILALLKFYHARDAARTGDLPGQYANMQAMENALGTSKKAIKWLLKNGAGEAQDAANRIAPLPVLRRAFEVIAQVADGHVTGIDGLEQWNKDTEIAKKVREDQIKGERENALADRRIFDLLTVEERVRTELLTPLRDGLHGLQKKFQRMKKNRELVATEIMTTDLPKLLEKLSMVETSKKAK